MLSQAVTITQNMAERMMDDLEKGKVIFFERTQETRYFQFPDFGKYVEQAEEESKKISNLDGKVISSHS